MTRLPLLLATALACTTPQATDGPAPDLPEESVLDEQVIRPQDSPPRPLRALGWVGVEGPVELARLEIRPEPAPEDPDGSLIAQGDVELARALCESPRDRLREQAMERVGPALLALGYLGAADPGECYGPAWCDWALGRLREGGDPDALSATLTVRLSGCRGDAAESWFVDHTAEARAYRALYDIHADKRLDLDTLDVLLGRMADGEDIHLAVVLVDGWGSYDADAVVERVLAAWQAAEDPGIRARIGRGLGPFADRRARAAWELSCQSAETWTCESVAEAPLLAEEDLGARLVGIAGRTGRYGLRPVLARALLDGLSPDTVSDALGSCVEQADAGLTAEICLDALVDLSPDAVPGLAARLLTSERPWWPLLRRRLHAARLGSDATLDTLRQAGLLPDGVRPHRRALASDPVLVLTDAGRAAPVFESDPPLSRLDLLRRLLTLLDLDQDAVVDLPAEDPYRPVVWIAGERLTTTLNRDADPGSINANGLAAFANAVAAHRGLDRRLLVQPQYSRYVQSDVVVGTPDALQRAIDAGLLTAPSQDAASWARDRARWAAESVEQVDVE